MSEEVDKVDEATAVANAAAPESTAIEDVKPPPVAKDKESLASAAHNFLPRLKRQFTQQGEREKPSKVIKEDDKAAEKGMQASRRASIKATFLSAVKTPMPGAGSPQGGKKAASAKDAAMIDTSAKAEADANTTGDTHQKSIKESGLAVYRNIRHKVWELNEPSEMKKEEARIERERQKAEGGEKALADKTAPASNSEAKLSDAGVDKPVPALPKDDSTREKRRWSVLAQDVVKGLFVVHPPRPRDVPKSSIPVEGQIDKADSSDAAKTTKANTEASASKGKDSRDKTWAKRATQILSAKGSNASSVAKKGSKDARLDGKAAVKAPEASSGPPKPVEKDVEDVKNSAKEEKTET